MFKQVMGQSAVVRKGGVYRTCELYEFRGQLFAKHGGDQWVKLGEWPIARDLLTQ